MPRSVLQGFSSKDKDVYVNTHYQHFERTIEDIKFKKQATNIFAKTVININEAIKKEYNNIEKLEKDFLKMLYPNQTLDSARSNYKDDVKGQMKGFSISSDYLKLRDSGSAFSIKDAVSKNFNYIEKELRSKKIIGNSTNIDGSSETVVQKYMKEKLKIMQDFFGELSDFLDSIYSVLSNLTMDQKPTLLNTMRGKAAKIGNSSKKLVIGRSLPPTFQTLLKNIRDIQNGKIKKFSDLGNSFHSKMFTSINESMYEYVSAAALAAVHTAGGQASAELVNDLIRKSQLVFVGQEGHNKKSGLGTTDYIFYFGTLGVGFDVKANSETYTHNNFKKNHMTDLLTEALSQSGMPFGKVQGIGLDNSFVNLFSYALVNMMTMDTIRGAGINVKNAAPVNQGKMYIDLFLPIQKIGLIVAVSHFVDEYLGQFDTARRKQIVILLGDNIVFLTEFLEKIKSLIGDVLGGKKSYSEIGYINIGDIQKNVEKWSNKGSLPQSMVSKLNAQKTDWIQKKMSDSLFVNAAGAGSNSWYPQIFSDASIRSQMKQISKKVLGKNYQTKLSFTFNRFTTQRGATGLTGQKAPII